MVPECQDCFESGRCSGTVITSTIAATDCACQTTCSGTQGCSDFTFDSSNGICSVHSTCTSLSTCATCASGPAVCPTEPSPVCDDCFEVGRCNGTVTNSIISTSDCECQESCMTAQGCTDFTFDSSNGICSFYTNCNSLSSCSSCASGPAACPTQTTTTTTTTTTRPPPGSFTSLP